MEIALKQFNRVDVIALSGRMDADNVAQLEKQLDSLFRDQRFRIVLDFAGLEYMSSAGLRVMVQARKRSRDGVLGIGGGDIRIANLSPRLKELFDLVGFTGMFNIYPDTLEAVGSY